MECDSESCPCKSMGFENVFISINNEILFEIFAYCISKETFQLKFIINKKIMKYFSTLQGYFDGISQFRKV